jgi:hypothetical protein
MKAKKPTRDQSMLWGFSIESLDWWGVVFMISGGILGVLGLIASLISAYVLYRVADISQKELVSETRTSAELIAGLNNDTARLTADNLALQTVLLPRHAGIFGVNGRPKAETWFAGMEAFAGVPFVIQPTDDHEARNLAAEIALALATFGVKANIDEGATSLTPSRISEGVSVAYATGKPWTKEKEEPNQPWFEWAKAANVLADALTKAGLGVGEAPVQRYGFISAEDPAAGNFKTIREGVLVYVGQRPVSHTIAWIKQGRPDAAGNKPADAAPIEPHK